MRQLAATPTAPSSGTPPRSTQTPAPRDAWPIPLKATPAPFTRRTGEFPLVAPKPPPAASPVQRLDGVIRQIEKGEFDQALAAAQKLSEEDSNLNALLTLGNIYALMGRNAEARDTFVRVLGREPLCVEARIYGAISALQTGALPDARAELGKALFLEPTLALGYFLLAQVEERAGEKESARRAYRNAVAQLRFRQRPLAGYYPDLPDSPEVLGRAARYALAALEEV
jgi:chemotaxis protein methyltransferase CheR